MSHLTFSYLSMYETFIECLRYLSMYQISIKRLIHLLMYQIFIKCFKHLSNVSYIYQIIYQMSQTTHFPPYSQVCLSKRQPHLNCLLLRQCLSNVWIVPSTAAIWKSTFLLRDKHSFETDWTTKLILMLWKVKIYIFDKFVTGLVFWTEQSMAEYDHR